MTITEPYGGEQLAPVSLNDEWAVLTPLINDATGQDVDLSDARLRVSLSQDGREVLSGSVEDETIILVAPTLMQWCFDPKAWAGLRAGNYDVNLDVEIGGEETRVFAGVLPIVEGDPA